MSLHFSFTLNFLRNLLSQLSIKFDRKLPQFKQKQTLLTLKHQQNLYCPYFSGEIDLYYSKLSHVSHKARLQG
jgi:hypothetical protein